MEPPSVPHDGQRLCPRCAELSNVSIFLEVEKKSHTEDGHGGETSRIGQATRRLRTDEGHAADPRWKPGGFSFLIRQAERAPRNKLLNWAGKMHSSAVSPLPHSARFSFHSPRKYADRRGFGAHRRSAHGSTRRCCRALQCGLFASH